MDCCKSRSQFSTAPFCKIDQSQIRSRIRRNSAIRKAKIRLSNIRPVRKCGRCRQFKRNESLWIIFQPQSARLWSLGSLRGNRCLEAENKECSGRALLSWEFLTQFTFARPDWAPTIWTSLNTWPPQSLPIHHQYTKRCSSWSTLCYFIPSLMAIVRHPENW